jgi:hypothetical protein
VGGSTVTAIISAFVGIASALLTIFLTPNLQHYFWKRQRQAERQFAVIDEVSKLGSEYRFLLWRAKDGPLDISDREEHLLITLHATAVTIQALFSAAGAEEFRRFLRTFEVVRASPERQDPQQVALIVQAHSNLLITLYKEVGIPAPSLPHYWHENFVPPLQRVWTATEEGVTRLLARSK